MERMTSQMWRAAYSMASNRVEGCGRESDTAFRRFLIISQGTANEPEYFTNLVHDLGYFNKPGFKMVLDKENKVGRSLNNLINKVELI
ncbi:MAG: four helix bundle protein [Bacteroidota bacterium]